MGLQMMTFSAELAPEFVTEGQIRISSRLSEYDGISAFPLLKDGQYYIRIENSTNILDEPIEIIGQPYHVKVVLLGKDELIVFSGVPIIRAAHYQILPDGLQLLSTQELGDGNTRFMDAVKLKSGKVLVSWYEHVYHGRYVWGQTSPVDIGFAYRRTDGTWETLPYTTVENHSTIPSTRGVLCQHPADDSIWSFTVSDANKWVHAIHLSDTGETISVDWVNSQFTDKPDGDMRREGEFPFLVATPDPSRNSILLAYQNKNYKFFSTKPFIKGANICVIQVNEDGEKELLFLLDRWVERISPFALGVLPSGEFWLAYRPIDPETLSYQELYLMKSSEEMLLGQVPRAGLINSNYHLLFNLSDGIYSYWVGEKPSPSPPPTVTVFMGKATWELSGVEKSAAVVVYATTEVEAMDKLIEYIMVEFPEATNIQFSYERVTLIGSKSWSEAK